MNGKQLELVLMYIAWLDLKFMYHEFDIDCVVFGWSEMSLLGL